MTRMTARPTPASAPVPAPDDPSDEDLLARYARGDARAARELAERHGPRLLGYARRMLRGDSAEAEDVLQEAMLRLWRIAPEWDAGRARVGTWLYRVVTNLCIDRLRRRPQAALDTIAEPPDDRPGAEAGMMQAARGAALHDAVDALPDRQRQAILLRHFEGLSNPEIGAVMDIGVEAVESLLARGKRALVAALAGRRETLGYDDDTA
jgi:RNA polymerase sigma-70 factor (ECF subfamily)